MLMRLLGFGLSVALLCLLAGGVTTARAQDVGTVYVFGDSAVDAGNVLHTILTDFPFVRASDLPSIVGGRLCNGPNWADYFAAVFGQRADAYKNGGNNYAYGGARTGDGSTLQSYPPLSFTVPNVGKMIDYFAAKGHSFSPNDLVIVHTAHNDAALIATSGKMADPGKVSAQLLVNLERLYKNGARLLIVPTPVAAEYMPLVMQYGLSEAIGSWLAVYQAKMAEVVAIFLQKHPDAVVLVPDIGGVTRDMAANPGKYGLANVTETACDPDTGEVVSNPDEYLWWDEHATTAAQVYFAKEALNAVGDYFFPREMRPQAVAASYQVARIMAHDSMARTARRLRSRPAGQEPLPSGAFLTPTYRWGRQSSTGSLAAGFDWKSWGASAGYQAAVGSSLLLGFGVDAERAESTSDSDLGRSWTNALGMQLFFYRPGTNWHVGGGVRAGLLEVAATRPVPLTGGEARADFTTQSLGAWTEFGLSHRIGGRATLTPLLGLDVLHVAGMTTLETGAGLFNAWVRMDDYNSLRHLLGLEIAAPFSLATGRDLDLRLAVGWRHEYLDTRTDGSTALAYTPLELRGPDSNSDALSLELRAALPLGSSVSLELTYNGAISRDSHAQGFALQLAGSF